VGEVSEVSENLSPDSSTPNLQKMAHTRVEGRKNMEMENH
jgi:hypothetical protein